MPRRVLLARCDSSAAEWKEHQIWVGELKVVSRGSECRVVLTTKSTNKVFAECPIRKGGPEAVEKASDSSRYFALRIEDPKSGRHMWLGVGFSQRSDAFDFSVALQEHDKDAEAASKPSTLDLGDADDIDLGSLEDGKKIKIAIKGRASKAPKSSKPTNAAKFALPKPSAGRLSAPKAGGSRAKHTGDMLGLEAGMAATAVSAPAAVPAPAPAGEELDFFGSAPAPVPAPETTATGLASDDDWGF